MENKILSYAQLAKAIAEMTEKNFSTLMSIINSIDFDAEDDKMYNNKPLNVMYAQLPVVINGLLLVKVLVLQQGESIALVVPEDITKIYTAIKEADESELTQLVANYNLELSLYAEVYGFNSSNIKLHNLIKSSFLSAGNSLSAFELAKEIVEKDDKDSDNDSKDIPPLSSDKSKDFNIPEENAIQEEVDFEELLENAKAFKKFTTKTKALDKLVKSLLIETSDIIKNNIKFKFINSILIVEVNNKKLFDTFPKAKAVAKKTISKIGENIRFFEGVQLIDSFIKNGKRYHVLAEKNLKNFWTVSYERLDEAKHGNLISINNKDIIKLKRSSIRKESRDYIPYKKDSKIVFKGVL